ncbi:hypothetical protein L249_5566 [Ophiocordyceps polyrhachis-furcata BCC 54312]|uniref:Uncharacterized protein n=1 Tax=Ophiocordyceps polyrhachis-furcata BCC 54312 TaxID=1330021 RepID=A0A367LGQ8_9HYPO|nr:hypothetical protein L249_5566 [Ophiocordyceps polyrhachis-furcata BCC 54312]
MKTVLFLAALAGAALAAPAEPSDAEKNPFSPNIRYNARIHIPTWDDHGNDRLLRVQKYVDIDGFKDMTCRWTTEITCYASLTFGALEFIKTIDGIELSEDDAENNPADQGPAEDGQNNIRTVGGQIKW